MSRLQDYKSYIESDHWKELRLKKLSEHGRFCDACSTKSNLHVHHIYYKNRTDCTTEDLAVLCVLCHDDFHLAAKCFHFDYEGVQVPEIKFHIAEFRASDHKARIENKRAHKALKRSVKPNNGRRKRILKACQKMFTARYTNESIKELISFLSNVISEPVPVVEVQVYEPAPPRRKTITLPDVISEQVLESLKSAQLKHKRRCAVCGSANNLRAFILRPNTMRISNKDLRTLCSECADTAESQDVTKHLSKFPENSSASLFAHFQIAYKRAKGIKVWEPMPRVATPD